ncbi:YsnF/AvaK domain-containing protein [Planomicrobium sp. YIM 101495]|uniref:YsnF/AvaK domain-containing protein n=1 Tax=Planomicrobium sp. YIM 101495 TaxID=2665160 RepID=UPI0012B925BF|nr:YsnF/AvaK domain-containing protein [Planomicrobium sp. YIM 101495]MTD29824.1 YsnF/AvaK domain-containing protein [Planomicrobium sp. YIM 101495]
MASEREFIGSFDLEAQAFNKIGELKDKGYREENIHIVSDGNQNLDILKEKTSAQFTFEFDESGRQDFERGKILVYADPVDGASLGTAENTFDSTRNDFTDDRGEQHLHLHEEHLEVDKQKVQTGEVNVGKHVVEEQRTVEVPVEHDEVVIERRTVNEDVNGLTGTDAYQDEENIHIPLTEERVDVSKKDVVSEELVVGKRKVQDVEHVEGTVRREEAAIEEKLDEDDRFGRS